MEKDEQSLNILILSDIHFGWENGKNFEETIKDQRKDCLKNLIDKLEEISTKYPISLVIIVGDIAFSSGEKEYKEAEKWIRKLFSKIGLKTENHLVLCPGNHDIKQQKTKPYDTNYFPNYEIATKSHDLKHLNQISKRYSKYEEFIERLGIKKTDLTSKNGISYESKKEKEKYTNLIQIKKLKELQITALNSSWFSRNSDYDYGKMTVGLPIIQRLKINNEITKYDEKSPIFSIICFHHPFDFLWPEEKEELFNELPELAHLVITGHIHNRKQTIKMRNDHQFYDFQCGATYDSSKFKNMCHILELEPTNYIFTLFPLTWEDKKWSLDTSIRYPNLFKKKGPNFTSDFGNPMGSVKQDV